ncbi:hypothetical protein HanIR_Chr04g0176721 [Helianthus annuus]|nr:hypothetical protein HanIR_Chr04g0176721 [Helianthus annuus]
MNMNVHISTLSSTYSDCSVSSPPLNVISFTLYAVVPRVPNIVLCHSHSSWLYAVNCFRYLGIKLQNNI